MRLGCTARKRIHVARQREWVGWHSSSNTQPSTGTICKSSCRTCLCGNRQVLDIAWLQLKPTSRCTNLRSSKGSDNKLGWTGISYWHCKLLFTQDVHTTGCTGCVSLCKQPATAATAMGHATVSKPSGSLKSKTCFAFQVGCLQPSSRPLVQSTAGQAY